MKKLLITLIITLNFKISFSQQIFKNYGERETVEELDSNLLEIACKNSDIQFKNIYLDKSFSKRYNENTTFFSVRYITDKLESENYYTTAYLLVNKRGEIIKKIQNKDLSYSDNEAGQPSPTRILSKILFLNKETKGIGLITEYSSSSRINLYSEELFTIIELKEEKSKEILKNYPIRKTNGDSNGWGNYEIEIMESLIFIDKTKSNNYYNLRVLKNFTYENQIEKNLEKNINERNEKKEKKETEILKFNGLEYEYKKHDYKFLKF